MSLAEDLALARNAVAELEAEADRAMRERDYRRWLDLRRRAASERGYVEQLEEEGRRESRARASMNPVVAVRALALEDELRGTVTLHKLARMMRGRSAKSGFYLNGPDLHYAAQRLASVCERELGTRGRHYDERKP